MHSISHRDKFWAKLAERVAPYRLLGHPFYLAWSAGELSREDLSRYAQHYFPHVAAFPGYLARLYAEMPDGAARRDVLKHIIDEEGLDAPDHAPHTDLWLDFASGMGAPSEPLGESDWLPAVKALINIFQSAMVRAPAAAITALYVYESAIPEIAREKAAGLRAHYQGDTKTIRYFDIHAIADEIHAADWRTMINQTLDKAPQNETTMLETGEAAAQALWHALDDIESERWTRRSLIA